MDKPLAVDLFCGLGGWADGLLAEGYDVIGFDIERHVYGEHRYPAQLVLQDVLTIHGSQFRDAALIVASPPCQEFSYMAMPWSLAKQKRRKLIEGPPEDRAKLTALFDACFRIQREACDAAGHHIPLVVENVRGACEWVGRSRWNFGSFHLWGDVPALMPMTSKRGVMKAGIAYREDGVTNFHGQKREIQTWSDFGKPGYKAEAFNGMEVGDQNEYRRSGKPNPHFTMRENQSVTCFDPIENQSTACFSDGLRQGGDWFNARKAASAMIAKIPLSLARHIARTYRPEFVNADPA